MSVRTWLASCASLYSVEIPISTFFSNVLVIALRIQVVMVAVMDSVLEKLFLELLCGLSL